MVITEIMEFLGAVSLIIAFALWFGLAGAFACAGVALLVKAVALGLN